MISYSEDVKKTKPWISGKFFHFFKIELSPKLFLLNLFKILECIMYYLDLRIKKKHVMLEHWKYIECEFCQNAIDPEKIAKHKARHHGVVSLVYTVIRSKDYEYKN